MIRPEKKSIEDILKTSSQTYSVPIYQRNFDWGKNELQQLIDDLKEARYSRNKELFLGNFIFDVSDKSNFKIVDGQQRITTISIILIALREHAKKIKEYKLATELQGLITTDSSWRINQGNKITVADNIKLLFDHISNPDWNGKYTDKIDGNSVKRQINKIRPILNYILNEISKYKKKDLLEFTRALLDSYVIVIQVDNTEDVFSIFERTNGRGLDLNIGDLLKNYIFAHGAEKYEEKWNEIIENSENSLQRVLKYFWISRKGYIQQSKLYNCLKNHGSELGIDKFVKELYIFSRFYKTAQSLESVYVKEFATEINLDDISLNVDYYTRINRVLQALKLFRVTQAYPVIFSIFHYYKKSKAPSIKILFNTIEAIEKYHFVNNVISGRIGNEVEKFYAEYAEKFYTGKNNFNADLSEFQKKLRDKKAHRDEFISNFIENVNYDNIQLVNYVYDRINNIDTKGGQRIDLYSPEKEFIKRNYNIEHILSQDNKKKFSNEEEIEAIDKIGNLIVISRHSNSEFQNKSPFEKYKIMSNDAKHYGNLRYIQEFLKTYKKSFVKWDCNVINKRSRKIAEHAFDKIWHF